MRLQSAGMGDFWRRQSTGRKVLIVIVAVLVLGGIAQALGFGGEEEVDSGSTTTAGGGSATSGTTFTGTDAQAATSLDPGQCFQDPSTDPVAETTTTSGTVEVEPVFLVTVVDSAELHDFEATTIYEAEGDDDEYPGADGIVAAASGPCEEFFAEFVGAGSDESLLESLPLFFPTQTSWEAGFRDVLCVAASDDGARTAGSARDQGPTG